MTSDLLIRADANTNIGTGHVMRCLALAQAWQNVGGTAHFLCAKVPDGLVARLTAEGMVLHRLNEPSGSKEDAEQTTMLAQKIGSGWVVEDGYHFDADYQRAIKNVGLRLLAIDDYGHAKHYVADLVLNQNIYANESLYHNREPTTQLLLGTEYALLRREFWPWRGWRRMIPNVARNILVTMGGGDPDNQTLKVIRAIQQINGADLSVIVVVGGSNPHLATLEVAISDSPSIRLIQNVTNMPELMTWSDIAISAGGSTCWELAFLGVPALLIATAENQLGIVQHLHSRGIAFHIGWYNEISVDMISDSLFMLTSDIHMRTDMCLFGQSLTDGEGNCRVVARMIEL